MGQKPNNPALDSLDAALAYDVLDDAFSSEDVDLMLTRGGGNPSEIGHRGARNALITIVSNALDREPDESTRGLGRRAQSLRQGSVFASRLAEATEDVSDEELAKLVEALAKSRE